MPIYEYKCRECGHEADEFQRMADPHLRTCPACKADAYMKQVSLPATDLREFHKPIEMLSIAMNDQQEIREFARRCPDVDISDDPRNPNYGVPVARSRKAKMQALKASGFQEMASERVRR